MSLDLQDVLDAAAALQGSVLRTPCLLSRTLSGIAGAQLYLKFENHQFTASFKERGALNKLLSLTAEQRARGVIAASAGNHAQGVAYHARRLGIPATIVMPRYTPGVKVVHTRGHGAQVILHGELFDEARARAQALAEQGTIALEMLADFPELDALVVPIGGGGMIAGIALAAKAIAPRVEVIGVQTRRFPSMYCALHGTQPQFGATTIADGIAVKSPGALTTPIVRRWVSDILLVDEGDLEQAVVMLLEIEKTVVEGAGAAGLAAVLAERERFAGRKVGLVLSGGNIDPLMLADLIERGMVRTGRLTRLTVELRDLPGALAQVTACLAEQNANIEEIFHQRAFTSLPVQTVEVDFVLETRDREHVQQVIDALAAAGFSARLHND
jgi:threonine dehydratase